MRKRNVLAMVLLLLALRVGAVKADEVAELKQQMAQMQQRLEQIEMQQAQQNKQMEEQISKAVKEKQIGALPDSLKWAENIKWSGDLRYRHESIDDDTKITKRNRNRIRARLKMKAKIND